RAAMHDAPGPPRGSVGLSGHGIAARPAETRLTERALEFLSVGPSDAKALIEHVCQMPGAPNVVAEQMALALFAERPEFVRSPDGRWSLSLERELPRTTVAEPLASYDATYDAATRDELGQMSYVVVDVETTGTSPWRGDRITEIAAIVVRDGAVVERFETLVNPERSIPPMITALTQITWEMVRDAPRFRDICDQLLSVLSGHVFVAHNADFDWRFVTAEVQRASGRRLSGRRLCTVRLARRVLPQLRSRRLDSVANYYGVEILARHRAAGDAVATAHVLLRLLDEARDRDCRCWDDLQRLLASREFRAPRPRRPSAMPRPVDKDTTA
ncbi:MAG TPA: 3'-5' exonuclease, partial [Gemmatimonadaceae bacterium]